ncbi:MAG: hypothetical protein KDB16_02445, partial [Acidimicrobiales bacterium]|nr:hypothetical protein [Acidimicrobiales bacterium]
GTSPSQVAALCKQFGEMQKMMKGLMGPAFAKKKAKRTKKKGKKAAGGRVTASKKQRAIQQSSGSMQLPQLDEELLKQLGDQQDVPFRLPGR